VNVVLDDLLLIEELLAGGRRPGVQLHPSFYWYHCACRAAKIWLSPEAANGVFPAVLDGELLAWEIVTPK
jgi:hypothetical protein